MQEIAIFHLELHHSNVCVFLVPQMGSIFHMWIPYSSSGFHFPHLESIFHMQIPSHVESYTVLYQYRKDEDTNHPAAVVNSTLVAPTPTPAHTRCDYFRKFDLNNEACKKNGLPTIPQDSMTEATKNSVATEPKHWFQTRKCKSSSFAVDEQEESDDEGEELQYKSEDEEDLNAKDDGDDDTVDTVTTSRRLIIGW